MSGIEIFYLYFSPLLVLGLCYGLYLYLYPSREAGRDR